MTDEKDNLVEFPTGPRKFTIQQQLIEYLEKEPCVDDYAMVYTDDLGYPNFIVTCSESRRKAVELLGWLEVARDRLMAIHDESEPGS